MRHRQRLVYSQYTGVTGAVHGPRYASLGWYCDSGVGSDGGAGVQHHQTGIILLMCIRVYIFELTCVHQYYTIIYVTNIV